MEDTPTYGGPVIYTIGAHLRPLKITYPSGLEVWHWVVTEFEDSSFRDGEDFNPPETAYSLDELLVNTTEEESDDKR